jgi:hypothetical protein
MLFLASVGPQDINMVFNNYLVLESSKNGLLIQGNTDKYIYENVLVNIEDNDLTEQLPSLYLKSYETMLNKFCKNIKVEYDDIKEFSRHIKSNRPSNYHDKETTKEKLLEYHRRIMEKIVRTYFPHIILDTSDSVTYAIELHFLTMLYIVFIRTLLVKRTENDGLENKLIGYYAECKTKFDVLAQLIQ